MASSFQKVLDQARSLSHEEQLLLIARLSEALAQADPEQVMLDPASEAEVQRRIQTHEAGVGKTLSGEEFRRQMREKHGA